MFHAEKNIAAIKRTGTKKNQLKVPSI